MTGALGGRFDHEAANINILYLFSDMRIVLLSDDCLIRLLPKTHKHEIYIESSVEGPHCGLFPVGAPSGSTTTTGLKWNLSTFLSQVAYSCSFHVKLYASVLSNRRILKILKHI